MAKDQGVNIQAARNVVRSGRPATPKPAGGVKPAPVVAAPKPRTSMVQFFREVRVEARKTTWTPWKETWVISVMVFVMVVVTSIFFLLVDSGLSFFIQQILKLAG